MAGMTDRTKPFAWPRFLRPLMARSSLLVGGLVLVGVYFATGILDLGSLQRGLLGWDCGVLVVIGLLLRSMIGVDLKRMKRRAAEEDQGKRAIMVLAIAAALASVAAIAGELATAKNLSGKEEGFQVALAIATIALSWTFVQLMFALHYAHIFYGGGEESSGRVGGLNFPEGGTPDYWDFVHFAIVIGSTAQTADIAITSRSMRRVATAHTLIAFTFNTAILAVMINVVASLL